MGKGIIVFLMLLAGFIANSQIVQQAHAAAGHDKAPFAEACVR